MSDRVETGPVQFDDDWPGIFIRGDDTFAYAQSLDWLIDIANNNPNLPPSADAHHALLVAAARGLLNTLRSCHIKSGAIKPLDIQRLKRTPMT